MTVHSEDSDSSSNYEEPEEFVACSLEDEDEDDQPERTPSLSPSHTESFIDTSPGESTTQPSTPAKRISHVPASDLNDIALDEAETQEAEFPEQPRLSEPAPRALPPPIDTIPPPSQPQPSQPQQRGLFQLWSAIKKQPPASTQPHSPTAETPMIVEHRSLATRDRTKRLSQQDRSQSEPALLHNQDDILSQMEQLNMANTQDPKASSMFKKLKRQSIRQSLVNQSPGEEGAYDWGKRTHSPRMCPFVLKTCHLDFWAGALCDFEQTTRNKAWLAHVRRGIPPSIRGLVWQLLVQSKQTSLQDTYMDLLQGPSPYEKMIQRDLARTFPGHKFFKERDGVGQEGLYNVVRSYSVYDQEVGYCQGLAFIVGPLLLNVSRENIPKGYC